MGANNSNSNNYYDPTTNANLIDQNKQCKIYRNQQGEQFQKYKVKNKGNNDFQNRYNYRIKNASPYLVDAYSVKASNNAFGCASGEQYQVVTQRIPVRLSELGNLSGAQSVNMAHSALKGFQQIFKSQGALLVKDTMIGVNKKNDVKVWMNSNYSINEVQQQPKSYSVLSDYQKQSTMVDNIIYLINSRCKRDPQWIQFVQQKHREGRIGFQQSIRLAQNILGKHSILPNNNNVNAYNSYPQQIDSHLNDTRSYQVSNYQNHNHNHKVASSMGNTSFQQDHKVVNSSTVVTNPLNILASSPNLFNDSPNVSQVQSKVVNYPGSISAVKNKIIGQSQKQAINNKIITGNMDNNVPYINSNNQINTNIANKTLNNAPLISQNTVFSHPQHQAQILQNKNLTQTLTQPQVFPQQFNQFALRPLPAINPPTPSLQNRRPRQQSSVVRPRAASQGKPIVTFGNKLVSNPVSNINNINNTSSSNINTTPIRPILPGVKTPQQIFSNGVNFNNSSQANLPPNQNPPQGRYFGSFNTSAINPIKTASNQITPQNKPVNIITNNSVNSGYVAIASTNTNQKEQKDNKNQNFINNSNNVNNGTNIELKLAPPQQYMYNNSTNSQNIINNNVNNANIVKVQNRPLVNLPSAQTQNLNSNHIQSNKNLEVAQSKYEQHSQNIIKPVLLTQYNENNKNISSLMADNARNTIVDHIDHQMEVTRTLMVHDTNNQGNNHHDDYNHDNENFVNVVNGNNNLSNNMMNNFSNITNKNKQEQNNSAKMQQNKNKFAQTAQKQENKVNYNINVHETPTFGKLQARRQLFQSTQDQLLAKQQKQLQRIKMNSQNIGSSRQNNSNNNVNSKQNTTTNYQNINTIGKAQQSSNKNILKNEQKFQQQNIKTKNNTNNSIQIKQQRRVEEQLKIKNENNLQINNKINQGISNNINNTSNSTNKLNVNGENIKDQPTFKKAVQDNASSIRMQSSKISIKNSSDLKGMISYKDLRDLLRSTRKPIS